MFQDLKVFQMAQAMSRHAGARQDVVARNVANSDTPGFKARDLVPFADVVTPGNNAFAPRATRATHLVGQSGSDLLIEQDDEMAQSSPNGNSVDLEDQMLKAVETERQQDKAIAIYRNGLSILRTSIGVR